MSRKLGCAFNYSGSKIRHIETINEILPKEENFNVLDVFCGGASLATNLPTSWKVTANDLESRLIAIHQMFNNNKMHSPERILKEVLNYNKHFIKDRDDIKGYQYAVETYNKTTFSTGRSSILYTLICSSFSNQLRWNESGEWNMPFGKRYLNPNMQKNLLHYLNQLKEKNITFTSEDFREFTFEEYDLVICDSPYLKTIASYNEKGGWCLKDSLALMSKLDKLHTSGGRFIMFEESWSKGVPNNILLEWMTKYNVKQIGSSSDSCNYQRKGGKTQEVIIYNY